MTTTHADLVTDTVSPATSGVFTARTNRRSRRQAAVLCIALATFAQLVPSYGAETTTPLPQTSAPASATPDKGAEWKNLFDGKSLKGWKITDFAGHGEVNVNPEFRLDPKAAGGPAIILEMGAVLTGVTWTNQPPKDEYEISLEAAKLEGSDFFCALTFPAGGGHCSLIVGGWGGGVVGISSVDGMDASENETTKFLAFDKNRWYRIRLRVTKAKVEAWIDQDKVVDLVTTDRRITVRAGEIELAEPLGISVFQTKSALRNIRLRSL